jgi:L-ascorbate metabolism protein UlaG (beta-lactamase superfamily)
VNRRTASRVGLALAAALALAAGACFRRNAVRGPGDPDWGVRVTWFGHSCFAFDDSTGRKFLIDPFDETVGYDIVWVEPSVVMVTHDHFDHNYVRHGVPYEIMKSTGVHTRDGIEITGVAGFHDNEEGRRHGPTNFYVWEMGGIRFAHLGDVGQTELTAEQKEALKGVDVLFLPVGGKTTLDGAGAAALAQVLKPRIVVPMHYGNRRVRFFEFDPVQDFTKHFKNVVDLPDSDFQLRRSDLPSELTVYVPAVPDGRH